MWENIAIWIPSGKTQQLDNMLWNESTTYFPSPCRFKKYPLCSFYQFIELDKQLKSSIFFYKHVFSVHPVELRNILYCNTNWELVILLWARAFQSKSFYQSPAVHSLYKRRGGWNKCRGLADIFYYMKKCVEGGGEGDFTFIRGSKVLTQNELFGLRFL